METAGCRNFSKARAGFRPSGLQEEQALKDIDPSKNQGGKVTSQPGFFLAILFAFLGELFLTNALCFSCSVYESSEFY